MASTWMGRAWTRPTFPTSASTSWTSGGCSFERAILTGATFRGANLIRARMRGARLAGVNFEGGMFDLADLAEADFTGASLRGVRMEGATLTGARFVGANLEGAPTVRLRPGGGHARGCLRGARPAQRGQPQECPPHQGELP